MGNLLCDRIMLFDGMGCSKAKLANLLFVLGVSFLAGVCWRMVLGQHTLQNATHAARNGMPDVMNSEGLCHQSAIVDFLFAKHMTRIDVRFDCHESVPTLSSPSIQKISLVLSGSQ